MNSEQKKFLDENGLKILWNQISMQDYPNNTALTSIINTINTNKADKADIPNIDTTLSKSGAAADAKITGEAINNLSDLAQTQANWEQNDETAIDFIKGRTHYVQEGIYLPVAEFTMTSQRYSDPPVQLGYYTDYRITINDISYESRSNDYGHIYLLNNGVLIFGIYEIGSEDNARFIAELGDMYAGQQCRIIIEEIVKKEELKQLDERYIPNTIARVSEIPEPSNVYIGEQEPIDENIELWLDPTVETIQPIYPPATATIGQTIVVKAIDEKGVPTEWEAVDLASGVGRYHPFVDDWGDPVAEIVTSEEVQQIRINFPTNDYRECLVQFIPAVSSTATDRFMSGNAYIGSAFGGGEGTEFNTAHTNGQIFPSLWYAGVSPEGRYLTTARDYVRLTHSLVASQIKTTPFAYHAPYLGDIGFTVPSEHYFGIGTKVTVWGRK